MALGPEPIAGIAIAMTSLRELFAAKDGVYVPLTSPVKAVAGDVVTAATKVPASTEIGAPLAANLIDTMYAGLKTLTGNPKISLNPADKLVPIAALAAMLTTDLKAFCVDTVALFGPIIVCVMR